MDALQCQYASKPCFSSRSVKDNGRLHRLCEYHRKRANAAQRRWLLRQQAAPLQTEEQDNAEVADVSARTKRRRRAAGLGNDDGRPHRQRKRHSTIIMVPVVEAPVSPPSVDSAALLNTTQLSDEDLALLDEIMQSLEDLHAPIMTDPFVVGSVCDHEDAVIPPVFPYYA